MPTIQIILAPDLALDGAAFVQAWNEVAPGHNLPAAEAQSAKSPPPAFPIDPQLQQWLIYLAGAATPFVLDIAKDVLKTVITKLLNDATQRALPAAAPVIKVETITQPDGAVLLVVHKDQ